jgi:hypothetical protein
VLRRLPTKQEVLSSDFQYYKKASKKILPEMPSFLQGRWGGLKEHAAAPFCGDKEEEGNPSTGWMPLSTSFSSALPNVFSANTGAMSWHHNSCCSLLCDKITSTETLREKKDINTSFQTLQMNDILSFIYFHKTQG